MPRKNGHLLDVTPALLRQIRDEIRGMRSDSSKIWAEFKSLKEELKSMKEEIRETNRQIVGLRQDFHAEFAAASQGN